jgi:homoserine dehydrogenase
LEKAELEKAELEKDRRMEPKRIGIAGLGVVGGALLKLLVAENERFKDAGVDVRVTAVSARNRKRDRGVDISELSWFDDPVALARSDEIDIFVELMGGSDGPAHAAVAAAIAAGKHVVTANKALLAEHGPALARAAEEAGVSLLFEASVAGGVPVIRGVRSGAAVSRIDEIAGVLNGTCNYILTEMADKGLDYAQALEAAQRLGYAEADPTFDVGGVDAAHKLVVLGMVGFGVEASLADVIVEGIELIGREDIRFAELLGYEIRLIAIGRRTDAGLEMRVHPALVDATHPIAQVQGADNIVLIKSAPGGDLTLIGPGAGPGPTASAVSADIISVARGVKGPVMRAPAHTLKKVTPVGVDAQHARCYLRLSLQDAPGAIAGVAETLAKHGISIDSLMQPSVGEHPGSEVAATVIITTHVAPVGEVRNAVEEIAAGPFAHARPRFIRIEDFD